MRQACQLLHERTLECTACPSLQVIWPARQLALIAGMVVAVNIWMTAELAAQLRQLSQDEGVCLTSPTSELTRAIYNTVEEVAWRLTALPQQPGVTIDPRYTGEVFTNARGGISTNDATQYQALLDLPVTLDFQKMLLPLPGRFFLLGQHTHGRGLTLDFVGDSQVISNIDSFKNITRVNAYWWEFDCLDDRVALRVGKQDVNTEFLFIELADDFIQSTFQLSPSTAFPTYPDPSMAAVLMVQPHESWRLKVGLWDALASGGNFGFSGNDTVFAIGELEYKYTLAGTLPGLFVLGAAYESAGVLEGDPISPVQEYILQLEQWLYREFPYDEETNQGLAIFIGYYPRFPGDLVSDESIGDSFVAGVTYSGFIPSRDEDEIGVGVAWTELFRGGTNEETVFELYYDAQITRRLRVQPDMQYVVTPSGIERDSLVLGIRFELSL